MFSSCSVGRVNNPINAIDPDGRFIIFINGNHYGSSGKKEYWGKNFVKKIGLQLKDSHHVFVDGSMGGFAGFYGPGLRSAYRSQQISPSSRYKEGYMVGRAVAQAMIKGLAKGETIKIITHSMGSAWGRGFAKALEEKAKEMNITDRKLLTLIADFDPFQASSLVDVDDTFIQEFLHNGGLFGIADQEDKNADEVHEEDGPHNIMSFLNNISKLEEGTYEWNAETESWICTSCKD